MTSFLDRAGCWFLTSGIQEPSGGVARYYLTEPGANRPVSSEITGYAVSALAYLHARTGKPEYLDAAIRSADFLLNDAWSGQNSTYPFEPESDRAYFFDVGIIARGLMAAWRATEDVRFRDRATDAALSLAFDFMGDGKFHPVIELPNKQPAPEEPNWSREPGCYQLKSALAWLDLEDDRAKPMFERVLASALATHESFLEQTSREKVMDRLHAYCYFLEALLWVAARDEVRIALAQGISRAGGLLREIAPQFERSDVNAQLLRVRLIASHFDVVPLNEEHAREEAESLASFQELSSPDPRVRGGFWFGRKAGKMLPSSNPVSTAFGMQALDLWNDHQAGRWSFQLHQLI